VGMVIVRDSVIMKKYSSLIQPPENEFAFHNIRVHHIEPYMTANAPNFFEAWQEISEYIENQTIVCHNADFDLIKLEETLNYYQIPIPDFNAVCTYKLLGKGLKECCEEFEIEFNNHHDALADAEACARLYLKSFGIEYKKTESKNYEPFFSKKVEKADLIPDFNIENIDNPFYKKKIVFTGDLLTFTRKEAAHKVKCLGADVNTSISKKTNFVIVGCNPGPSKMVKIELLGIPIISEDDFLKMLGDS
jgi:DNA polymerase-3 subunit epsilon